MNKQDFIDRLRMALNGRVSPGLVMDNVNYYEDYITLPLILSVVNGLWYSLYIYIFPIPDPRASKSALLFYQDHAAGDHIYSCDHPVSIPSVPSASRRLEDIGKGEIPPLFDELTGSNQGIS